MRKMLVLLVCLLLAGCSDGSDGEDLSFFAETVIYAVEKENDCYDINISVRILSNPNHYKLYIWCFDGTPRRIVDLIADGEFSYSDTVDLSTSAAKWSVYPSAYLYLLAPNETVEKDSDESTIAECMDRCLKWDCVRIVISNHEQNILENKLSFRYEG